MYLAKEEIAEHFGTGSYGNGGLGMSRSRLKDAGRRKVSRTCKQHPANLPTKELTLLVANSPEVY
jgi:hypothetical protein